MPKPVKQSNGNYNKTIDVTKKDKQANAGKGHKTANKGHGDW